MRKLDIITKGSAIAVLFFSTTLAWSQKPVSHPNTQWEFKEGYSDEFNTGSLDTDKWNNDIGDWGTWSWEPENAYVKDTVLALQMQHDPHQRGGKDYYFTSGIVQIPQKITYGYFEAKIKACDNWPGEAPAFWLYSQGEPTPTEEGGVQYSEIDAVEIFQIVGELKTIEMNLHARIIKDGELTWIRPGQGYGEITRNSWEADWDPRDDYHTYGVMNRVDSIIWYVDGVERGRKKNLYWHLPMNVTVSMGLRNPYEKYIDGVRTVIETLESPEGFPTEMYCDYVRSWVAPSQILADSELLTTKQFSPSIPIVFDYTYDAGSGFQIPTTESGLTLKLQQKNSIGSVVDEYEVADSKIAGTVAGESSVTLNLPEDIVLTSELPEGNYYVLNAEFTNDNEDNSTVVMEEIANIQVTDLVLSTPSLDSSFRLFPNPSKHDISVEGTFDNGAEIVIYDLLGGIVYQSTVKVPLKRKKINVSNFSNGMYIFRVNSGEKSDTIRFEKF
ncbi:family 16 glycosylhydrolase [Reichenbachiella sp.]|uniref:family 16 glycosylhydrolase n=1 Tax=Reichenbachiella sp. TaxID=2184521 RepID=UPI003BAE5EB7